MKKKSENKQQKKYDRGQIFVKVMAAILAVMMIVGVSASLIFALIG